MLEARIEELTKAVRDLIGVLNNQQNVTLQEVAVARAEHVKEIPNEKPKSEPTSSTSPDSSPESAPVTYDDVKRATNAVSKISRDKAIAGLARFGVTSATKLTEKQWPEYVAYMAKVAANELDPEASNNV